MIVLPILAMLGLLITTGLATFAWLRTRAQLEQYGAIIDVEAECGRLRAEAQREREAVRQANEAARAEARHEVAVAHQARDALRTEVTQKRAQWEADYTAAMAELRELMQRVELWRDDADSQEHGIYRPIFDHDTPERFKQAIKDVRAEQKRLVKEKMAAVCQTEWTVEGSKVKGRQMTDRNLKLMLRAFNGECDACIARVNAGNVTTMMTRIDKAFAAINKLGEPNFCAIVGAYKDLKVTELRLTHERALKVQADKELQREIREQMREEARAQKEAEKAEREAARQEAQAEEALLKAREELSAASAEQHARLAAQIAELEARLAEAHTNRERAVSMAQLTRRGHVYIISNEGSFGRGVYKIGMTRRLEPLDRVKELGDASVPFAFDVHAMIFSEDAPSLESELHRLFDDRRLNKVNTRKEFFRVGIEEIERAVFEHERIDETKVEFIHTADAEEYRASAALAAEAQAAANDAEQLVEDARRNYDSVRQRLGAAV